MQLLNNISSITFLEADGEMTSFPTWIERTDSRNLCEYLVLHGYEKCYLKKTSDPAHNPILRTALHS